MSIPQTKILLSSTIISGGGYSFTASAPGDFAPVVTGSPVTPWLSGIADLNGDGLADFVFGAAGDDDKALNAGRIYVTLSAHAPGSSTVLGSDVAGRIVIDGVSAGDLAGASVGSISDQNGDGLGEILVGAAYMNKGAVLDAGAAFVLWGQSVAGGIDLADPFSGAGKGYAIKGEAAGDHAGGVVLSVGDMNGDGIADVLVGAAGNDAGGLDAGAAYVVWGKATDSIVQLTSVATGAGGFKIIGAHHGDAAGSVMAALADQNGDGRSEILIGVADDNTGGSNAGAVYVLDGKVTGGTVNLADLATGIGGYMIIGEAQSDAGAAVSSAGDVNGDGRADILIGAPRSDSAYVVFGKADHTNVSLTDVAAGIGGFKIIAEGLGDLDAISVTGGVDLNRDGIADFVIGASQNGEGGNHAGAVYVVWGGRTGPVDLSLIAQGIGGAKIVGDAGSLTGATVAIGGDANGDGVADLIIGAPGVGEAAHVLFTPLSWQPDHNVYGTMGNDVMGAGFGGSYAIGDGTDSILGLGGNDSIFGAGGNDLIEGNAGNDTLIGGLGDDSLDGGTGADSMAGGAGNDIYVVDSAGDVVTELAGEGADTIYASVSTTLSANVERLILTASFLTGTGNGDDNTLVGTAGMDTLNGGAGADFMNAGNGDDTYIVDNAFDSVTETNLGGVDTIISSIDLALTANIENLILTGAARIGTGNSSGNRITGTAFADTLNGGLGVDTLIGGLGDDSYVVDNIADVVIEAGGAGTDSVTASVNYTLSANVENLTLTGAGHIGTGNGLSNILTGTTGADTLDGGAGVDTLIGGAGNDSYVVDVAGDVVVELAGGGIDTVTTAFDYTLTAGEIENLALTGAAHHGTGNAGANTITGGAGADTLDGAAGADLLIGGAGDDVYVTDGLDTITEGVGGGIDTMMSGVSITLAANVENLVLTAAGITGTGDAGANALTGGAGSQTLIGLGGDDTLDGGAGADRMEGGAGNDTYFVDDAGDVVIEAAGGGIDTIVSTSNVTTIADNIENIRLTGTAHIAVGNTGDNTLSGATGDDDLDGGAGNDLLLGAAGNDTLTSTAGNDTLSGGEGDDRYHVAGGHVQIEDYLGHDTIDASDATGDSHIDLSGETESLIENEICHIQGGGSTSAPLDVQFLQDRTGSFGDDIATVRSVIPGIVAALQAVQANSMFGVSSFVDKPVAPFGAPGEWVYQQEMALSANVATLTATYNAMTILNGMDGPEAQIEGLMQLALHAAEVGFRPDSARFVVLFTDAPYHVAGDGVLGGITTPNNGDAFFPGGGALEDYPTIAQLMSALTVANIIPIFAVAGGFEATYQTLANQLGRGAVVSLTANSSNIVAAITAGLTAATTTHIEDACGGAGHDDIIGSTDDNSLTGNAGNDTLSGRAGHDVLFGGAGADTLDGGTGNDTLFGGADSDIARYTGARADYAVVAVPGGVLITDLRTGVTDGVDTVSGVDLFSFTDGTITYAQLLGLPPQVLTSVADTDAGVDTVPENSATGTVVGLDLEGRDAGGAAMPASFVLVTDATGATLSTTGPFQIDGTTGIVTVRDGTQLNFEAATSKTIFVATTGADGTTIITTHVIAVSDVFEPIAITRTLTALADTFLAPTNDHYTVIGLAGNDVITTGAGNDLIIGGAGNDTISTGAGADVIRVGGIKDGYDAIDGATGADRIEAVVAGTAIGLSAVTSIETITANGFSGVYVRGNAAANLLDFSGTVLTGIIRIEGGGGADTIVGSAGADTLVGGAGGDRLTGGAGADVFRFNLSTESKGAAFDTITDFAHLTDQIDLRAIDANTLVAGDQSFAFIGAAAFGLVAGEMRLIVGATGETRLLGDTNGDGKADFDIHLAPLGGLAVGLTSADILI